MGEICLGKSEVKAEIEKQNYCKLEIEFKCQKALLMFVQLYRLLDFVEQNAIKRKMVYRDDLFLWKQYMKQIKHDDIA